MTPKTPKTKTIISRKSCKKASNHKSSAIKLWSALKNIKNDMLKNFKNSRMTAGVIQYHVRIPQIKNQKTNYSQNFKKYYE